MSRVDLIEASRAKLSMVGPAKPGLHRSRTSIIELMITITMMAWKVISVEILTIPI